MKKVIFTFYLLFIIPIISTAQTVYITNTGSKYHTSDCRTLHKSSIPVELKEALDQGYSACKRCSPPTTVKSSEFKNQPNENKKAEIEPQNTSNPRPVVEQKKEIKTTNRCQAITKKRTQCKRMAQAGSNYCWQHK